MSEISFSIFVGRVKSYVSENWGSPFIIGFVSLLLFAAISLSAGSYSWADAFATCAYFALVLGVFLQLVCFLRSKGHKTEVII